MINCPYEKLHPTIKFYYYYPTTTKANEKAAQVEKNKCIFFSLKRFAFFSLLLFANDIVAVVKIEMRKEDDLAPF